MVIRGGWGAAFLYEVFVLGGREGKRSAMGLCLEDQMEDLEVSSVSSLQVLKYLQDISIEAIG